MNALGWSGRGNWGRTGEVYAWDYEIGDWVLIASNVAKRDCVGCGKTFSAYGDYRFGLDVDHFKIDYDSNGRPLSVLDRKVICVDCAPIDEDCPQLNCERCGAPIVVKWNGVKEPYRNYYIHLEPSDHKAIKTPTKYLL